MRTEGSKKGPKCPKRATMAILVPFVATLFRLLTEVAPAGPRPNYLRSSHQFLGQKTGSPISETYFSD